jgi:dihydrofolate reductase
MKLIASMMLTLDGVYQGPGGPDEDRRGGFERGGWTAAHADEDMWPYLVSMFERADALLLGRKTWEIWEPYWPLHDDNPIGHVINVVPKYVPSTTLRNPTWNNTHVLDGDVEAAIRELKAKPGRELVAKAGSELNAEPGRALEATPGGEVGAESGGDLEAEAGGELQVHGSGELLRWLLERDLVDELNIRLYPVIVGDGLRLFPERGPSHDLELVESRSTSGGVTLLTYRPAGRARFGNAGA